MGLKTSNTKSLELKNGTSNLDAQNGEQSNFDSEQLKLINELSPMRESIVKSVVNRFPMKGLDIIIKQAFDEAVAKNLREIKKHFLKTIYGKPQKSQTEESQQLKNEVPEDSIKEIQSKPDIKKPVYDLSESKNPNKTDVSPKEPSKNVDSMVEDYKKRVEQLILEIKVRDKKLKDNEKQINILKHQLEILEQQSLPPFLDDWKMENEQGEEDIEQLKTQVRLWEILWKKMRTFFEEDPKFKTIFILQRLGRISIKNLSQALNLDINQIEPIIQKLQESQVVKLDGDILKINTD